MNAILGTDRLPTGIVPPMSVITTVVYGSKERVLLKYETEFSIKRYRSRPCPNTLHNEAVRVTSRKLRPPKFSCLRKYSAGGSTLWIRLGWVSAIGENTLTTEAFLPEADALILVTSFESPLSDEELRFFKAGTLSGQRIFVVLNKHDTISAGATGRRPRLRARAANQTLSPAARPIFSVFLNRRLESEAVTQSSSAYTSGIPELEDQLLSFLLVEKNSQLLMRMCDRTREFLHLLPDAPQFKRLIARIDDLSQQFGRASLLPNLHQLRSCEICAHMNECLWNFVSKYQYEIIVGLEAQQRFTDRGGFCPFHAWQFQSVASPYGICAGPSPLLDRLRSRSVACPPLRIRSESMPEL
jgi:hypothetical protein